MKRIHTQAKKESSHIAETSKGNAEPFTDEQQPAGWSEDWREEAIQTRFAFYTYQDDPGTLYLSNVFVEEASRNHGFGTRILRAAEKVAETIGAITISLKVKQDSPANAWYRKNGYGYVAFEDGYDWLEKNLEYLKPAKQEWSEEDENALKYIHELIEFGYSKNFMDAQTAADMRRWINKSLRPQQPKQEWSEEDEKMRNSIIADYERSNKEWFAAQCSIPWGKKIDWLKALRLQKKCSDCAKNIEGYIHGRSNAENKLLEQFGAIITPEGELRMKPHWKPSEEQMLMLLAVINEPNNAGSESCHIALKSLLDDLKKL